MTKEDAIAYSCVALDEIAKIVNSLWLYEDKGHVSVLAPTKKQDVYRAVVAIRKITNKIAEVVDYDENI